MRALTEIPDYRWIPVNLRRFLKKDIDDGCEIFHLLSNEISFRYIGCGARERQAIVSVKDGDIQTAVFNVQVRGPEQDSKSEFKGFLETILKDCVRFFSVSKKHSAEENFLIVNKISSIYNFQDLPFDFYEGVSDVVVFIVRNNEEFVKRTVVAWDHRGKNYLGMADFFSEDLR